MTNVYRRHRKPIADDHAHGIEPDDALGWRWQKGQADAVVMGMEMSC